MSSDFEETHEYQTGLRGESLVSEVLLHDGRGVIDTCKASNSGAPVFRYETGDLILPDYLAHTGEGFAFVEVKTKNSGPGQSNGYVHYRKEDENRHGFDATHYKDYRTLRKRTGVPVFIVFYEVPNQQLRWGHLDELEVVSKTSGEQTMDFGNKHVVFFRRDDLDGVKACRFDGDSYVGGERLDSVSETPILPLASYERPQWGEIVDGELVQTTLTGRVIGND